ncbi:HlyD family secretion protein [Luteimonas vadosa]
MLLPGCRADPPDALGTLEYDRITLPAPAAERIAAVEVREGQRVAAGDVLMVLERAGAEAQTAAAAAEADRRREVLSELQAGARSEAIAGASASLAAAEARARDARAYRARVEPLGRRQLVAAAEVDRARAAAGTADAEVRAARARLDELRNGSRPEQVAQGRAALRAAEAQAQAQAVLLDKLRVVAPRAGRIDSLPYKLGDQAPPGAPLVVLLVGDSPHARVYVPEPLRLQVDVGTPAKVHVHGREDAYRGVVRMIRNDPGFTPYYALTGDDAARLSYLAEVALEGAADLPAGVPVRVEFMRRDDGD